MADHIRRDPPIQVVKYLVFILRGRSPVLQARWPEPKLAQRQSQHALGQSQLQVVRQRPSQALRSAWKLQPR
jgi:hypothetical protein